MSPDGRWLYATSELVAGSASAPVGSLSVIRIATAERQPSRSVVTKVNAGCGPVRVALSSDGRTVWVTVRSGNQLLAFSANELRTDPAHAQLAAVRVGSAPVGLALVNGGREVVVANSNRLAAPTAPSNLTVVSTAAALAHRPSVLGTIPAGAFPREMALQPGRPTLLAGNYGSDQLEAVDLRAEPPDDAADGGPWNPTTGPQHQAHQDCSLRKEDTPHADAARNPALVPAARPSRAPRRDQV